MDWMSMIPVTPTANPARYIAPTILAVVLYVFVPSAPVGVLEDVLGSASFHEHGCVSLLPPMEGQRMVGGQVAVLRPHAALCWPRNDCTIFLCKASVCAPWHKARQSTKEAPNS